MTRLVSILLLALAPGCASLVQAAGHTQWCAVEVPEVGMFVEGCDLDEGRRAHWRRNLPRIVQVYDEQLAALGLPPLSPVVAGYTVRLEKRAPTGPHHGVYEASYRRIRLWPAHLSFHWWQTVITHELWHLYEHEVFGLSEWGWVRMQDEKPPRHFMVGRWGSGLHEDVRREVLARDWSDPP